MSLLLAKTSRPMVTLGVRRVSLMHGNSLPQAAKAQVAKPKESGFYKYTRNWSRDKTFDLSKAPQKGDSPMFFLLRRLGHAYEVYPIVALAGWSMALIAIFGGFAWLKNEIWLDRSKSTAPWDWSRIKDNYYKQHTVLIENGPMFGNKADTHKRLEIMEKLQDEMLEAAKKRGTRK